MISQVVGLAVHPAATFADWPPERRQPMASRRIRAQRESESDSESYVRVRPSKSIITRRLMIGAPNPSRQQVLCGDKSGTTPEARSARAGRHLGPGQPRAVQPERAPHGPEPKSRPSPSPGAEPAAHHAADKSDGRSSHVTHPHTDSESSRPPSMMMATAVMVATAVASPTVDILTIFSLYHR